MTTATDVRKSRSKIMLRDETGSCCRRLEKALSVGPTESTTFFFRGEPSGMLFYKTGLYYGGNYLGAPAEPVIFCPFCGVKIQNAQDERFDATLYGVEAKEVVRRLLEEVDEVETLWTISR